MSFLSGLIIWDDIISSILNVYCLYAFCFKLYNTNFGMPLTCMKYCFIFNLSVKYWVILDLIWFAWQTQRPEINLLNLSATLNDYESLLVSLLLDWVSAISLCIYYVWTFWQILPYNWHYSSANTFVLKTKYSVFQIWWYCLNQRHK